MEEHTEPDEATEAEERAEAQRAHTADRPATDRETPRPIGTSRRPIPRSGARSPSTSAR